ncbi:MAG: hypothetical protein IJH48_05760 [Oscillospiraceae bacterium]|nr:hypothetical protein [Oscillospiraceae bacterium]
MKKAVFCLILAFVLLSFSACGSTAPAPSAAPAAAPDPTAAPPAPKASSVLPGSELQQTPTDDPSSEAPALDEAAYETARSLIGEEVTALYDAIGEPADASYAPSCLKPGQGEDGALYYDGFTVATYREGETEIVWDVNLNEG